MLTYKTYMEHIRKHAHSKIIETPAPHPRIRPRDEDLIPIKKLNAFADHVPIGTRVYLRDTGFSELCDGHISKYGVIVEKYPYHFVVQTEHYKISFLWVDLTRKVNVRIVKNEETN